MMIFTDFTKAQTRQRSQSPRAGPTGRALGLNPKTSSSSSSSEFSCPEEFGYFPHPSDCSLYYVCVFGGALLESCTGGLMYSHELQTCDWPRNVGCEMREITAPLPAPAREVTPRVPVSSRIRFSSLPTEPPSGPSGPSGPSAPAHIQQIQTLPPPPNQQRINPNPIITSRGQPKSYSEDEILKQLYAEAHDTLPPVEEEESDRQQRVYRGQPSTVTQVQRDRDGIIHQPSVNAIPTQQKGGSFVFNSQLPSFSHSSQATVFNFGPNDKKNKKEENKVIQITTKKPSYHQYPIPSSTPKYIPAYTTPNHGHTFSTVQPPRSTSSIPAIIKFPDDVFQAIRPFASPAPNIIHSNKFNSLVNKNNDITKPTTSTTERTSTKRTKIKLLTKPANTKISNIHQTTTVKPTRSTTRRKTYTIRPNRGNLKFKVSTKRPDLTRLEIDEKLPNRVEQSSPSPNSYNIPQKSQIKQNKNYYNTSNYNPSYDPYYTIYDDEIYGDVEYSNQFSNQQKSTPSSTYRPTTSQSPQTFAPKPQTQPTTYLTQTQAPKTYNQQIYDYDEALVAQLEESDRYGQHERQPNTDFRGDRNEINLSDRAIIKTQSPSRSNGVKFSSVPAFVSLSTPEPFSFKPTSSVTHRTFRPTTVLTTIPSTTPSTTSTKRTTEYQYVTSRSSLSEGSNNKTANNRIRITLSARAGSHDKPIHKVYVPFSFPSQSQSSSTPSIHTAVYTQSLPLTTLTSTTTSTIPPQPLISRDPLPSDHYYFSDQDAPLDYYENVDEINIPSSSVSLNKNNKTHSSSSIQASSSSTLSHSSTPSQMIVHVNDHRANQNRFRYKFSDYLEPSRYDQSTLKSYFMLSSSSSTTEIIFSSKFRSTTTTTEKPPSTTSTISTTTRDQESQRQKILSFIVSENQPSSFKLSNQKSTNRIVNSSNLRAYVNTQLPESTTVSHSNTTSTNSPRSPNNNSPSPTKTTILLSRDQLNQNKTIRLTLTSSLDSQSSPYKASALPLRSQGTVEEIPLIKSRQPETRQVLQLNPIEPTTYSPPKPFRFSIETTTKSETTTALPTSSFIIDEISPELESFPAHSRRRPYVNDFLTNSNIPTRFPPRTTTSEQPIDVTTEASTTSSTTVPSFRSGIQSFTSRGLVFKENLNRTLEPQNLKPIVSPYMSLEKQRLTNAIRTTSPAPRSLDASTSTTTFLPVTSSTYRSYFLITAPIKNKTIPSTFLFPETTSTPRSSSILTTSTTTNSPSSSTTLKPSPFSVKTESNSLTSTENSRGRYRPFVTFTSSNSIVEEPTTYSPRLRFNTRTQTMVDSSLPINDQPALRRKVVRLKSALTPPAKPVDSFSSSTDLNRIDVTTSTPFREVTDNIVALPSRETIQFKTLPSKSAETILSKLSYSSDSPNTALRLRNNFNQLASVQELRNMTFDDLKNKPFFYIRFKNSSNVEALETSTKKFRATVEMPVMNVPLEKELNSFSNAKVEEVNDEENSQKSYENEYESSRDYDAYVDSSSTTTVAPPSTYDDIHFNTTYSKIFTTSTSTYQPTTMTTTTSTLRTTERQTTTTTTANPKSLIPPRASRVNNAIKTSIVAGLPRRNSASIKCNDISSNAKCNEIPSRTPSRNRGSSQYAGDTQSTVSQSTGRGTHPPRPARPTLKPSKTVVEHAQQYVDIYRFPPTRPEPLYPQPTPDKTAAKCRKDVCQLPDCYCGGKDIPADMPVEQVPQIVLLTFDDSVNDLNKQLYQDLFERGRVNPNGCPISATFYVSHEWTDYSQVQNLYSDGHEMASHTVSHSFGEQFSLKKWAREIAGQREILSAYGGVKQADIRGMRAPFLSIGGNKMFKMLHDFNFTYDSSMPVYENRPPSWPYTLDYRIFHDCMIPPCPTKSYPGVWEVPMVMWQDLNGGRCSMGDACSNPADADGVYKMIMKNFERHYTTNRAPFGLYYHAAWFTQPHHKEGFINFLDAINEMRDVYIVTNWQALQWVRDPTPMSRINSFQPFQCNYQDRPKRCNNAKVCNLWHKSGVRYMRTCQPCPEIYPWTGKSGIRSSRIDNDLEVVEST
ncbi:CLUMA_CG001471, isoform A [Clunio marinus]|uniref:CLUMA_CG001471, isoform A n=1 Tax=Clunio marinus TaxID=568069 RepID=A0A1J1HMJ1_9DIPT|nr:CLUMA_CG001471, isoform A [Clunio marinus]